MNGDARSAVERLVDRARRAMALHGSGALREAEAEYRAVVAKVEHVGLYQGFGSLLGQTGRAAEGVRWTRRALILNPERGSTIAGLASLLLAMGDDDGAARWSRRGLRLTPGVATLHAALGIIATRRGDLDTALSHLRAARRSEPLEADHHFNLGVAQERRGALRRALDAHRAAVTLRPDHAGARFNAALCATLLGDAAAARDHHHRLLRVEPDHAAARFWRGNMRIVTGDWRGGWRDCEARRDIPELTTTIAMGSHLPAWNGEASPSTRLLVIGEQGIGDVLLAFRFLPAVARLVGSVVLQVHSPLAPLLTGRVPGVEVAPFGTRFDVDAAVPLLSLPGLLGVDAGNLPRAPYLTAPPERVGVWVGRLPEPDGERRFGLVWAGNPKYNHDRFRSPGLTPVLTLLSVPGWCTVALQAGEGRAAMEGATIPPGVIDVGGGLRDFADTAAVISQLDLVITSDTAVAHLAGAMGKPTWLMGPTQADWRWMIADDGAALWYPSVRIFRQTEPGDWSRVVGDIRKALGTA